MCGVGGLYTGRPALPSDAKCWFMWHRLYLVGSAKLVLPSSALVPRSQ
jgi:hypothetical protein